MSPSDRPAGCADRVRQPRVSIKRLTRLTQLTQEADSPPRTPPVSGRGRCTDAPPFADATGSGSATPPQDVWRLRRMAAVRAVIRDFEAAGLQYWRDVRPLVVYLAELIRRTTAPTGGMERNP